MVTWQMPWGWGNPRSAHFMYILCFSLLFAILLYSSWPRNIWGLFNWFVWLFSNTNVHKFISKSCYLLLENERHPTIYRGHTARYISQDLNADNENRTLYNLLLISHLFVYYIFFLINFASFPFFGFFCGSSSVKVVSFCAKLSRLPNKI